MVRKIIFAILGLLLIYGAHNVANKTAAKKEEWQPSKKKKAVVGVYVETVRNTTNPITINVSGNCTAKNKIELFSEVQGIFLNSRRAFKPGTTYKKGEVLLDIDKKEEIITLKAQKSSFYNQLVLMMPDMRMDYPHSCSNWEKYITKFDFTKPLLPLPTPINEQEKLFLSAKNIYAAYYQVQNLETQLQNFTIRAPFTGVLTEALVHPGTLIRSGQKLGVFMDDRKYELKVAVNVVQADLLKIGKKVTLVDAEQKLVGKGKVIRVNSMVDPSSQTIPVYIEVNGKGLREGMFLEAHISAKEEPDTYEVNRHLLGDANKLFIVKQDSLLDLLQVEPVFFKENTAIVKGIENGTKILSKMIPGAYAGMKVKIYKEETNPVF